MKVGVLKVLRFLKRHWLAEVLILVGLLVAGFVLWDNFSASTTNPMMGKLKPKKVTTMADPISGVQESGDVFGHRVAAIVIENSTDARPQSGLNKADLVYETFAEGGITRFLTLWHSQDYKEIGPVRSARPYFVDWAASYRALFVHVGGSLDGLARISSSTVYDLNQFYNGSYFWRDNARYAPHNVYTTLAKVFEAAKSHNYPTTQTDIQAYKFKKDAESKARPVAFSFTVRFNATYPATWTYSPTDNYFYRSSLSVPLKDRVSGEQIKAKNILIGFSDFAYGLNADGIQKVDIRTTGSGAAIIYIDGVKTAGTWERSGNNIIRFYDTAGKEVKLNPGTSWVEFAPSGTLVN